MNSVFLPEAEEEIREAARYYETEAPGVGITFVAEVRRAVRSFVENPYATVGIDRGIRRSVLRHFPYNIVYAVEPDLIVIVAVAHQKRRPRYCRTRIKQIEEYKEPPAKVARRHSCESRNPVFSGRSGPRLSPRCRCC